MSPISRLNLSDSQMTTNARCSAAENGLAFFFGSAAAAGALASAGFVSPGLASAGFVSAGFVSAGFASAGLASPGGGVAGGVAGGGFWASRMEPASNVAASVAKNRVFFIGGLD